MNPVSTLETANAVNPLKQLQTFGQSIWLDYIRRDLLKGGELQRLIDDDGLRGMTSNPSIFEKAIGESALYQDFLDSFANRADLDAKGRYEMLAIRDIQDAADLLVAGIQEHQPPRRLCQPGSLALPRPRHKRNAR